MTIFDDPFLQRIFLADLTAYDVDAGSDVTKYVSTEELITSPTDSPANTLYIPAIDSESILAFNREMYAGGRLSGQSFPDTGTLTIINTKNDSESASRFDTWLDADVLTWGGRSITVSVMERGADYSSRQTLIQGVIDDLFYTETSITFPLRSKALLLDKLIQDNRYAGTGGAEANGEEEGLPKPLCFGRCFNVSPVLVDGPNAIYQIHDGEIESVDEVRDRGVPLPVNSTADYASFAALQGASISSGKYATCLAEGFIRTGSKPDGHITCDVKGSTLDGTYSAKPGSIMDYIVRTYSDLTSSDIDSSSITAFDTARPYDIGYFIKDEINILDVFDRITDGLFSFYGFSRAGLFEVQAIADVTGTSQLTIDENNSFQDSIARDRLNVPISTAILSYRPNWSPQDESEIAGAVSLENRKAFAMPDRRETQTDASVKTKFADAIERKFDTLIWGESDAEAMAQILLDYYKERRDIFEVATTLAPLTVDLNTVITLENSRFNLSGGRKFVIVGMNEDYLLNNIRLKLAG